MTDAIPPPAPTAWSKVYGWAAMAARYVRRLWPILVAVVAIGFAFAVGNPWAPLPPQADVAALWNQSIARLGIEPVFPPQEDLYVGDLWAVILDSSSNSLLGKSVRIAHIDLREQINFAHSQHPIFSDTAKRNADAEYRSQETRENNIDTQDRRISLSLAAFPGITISNATNSKSSLGSNIGWFGASRDILEIEEIRIPVAETYGVPIAEAYGLLDIWCHAPATKIFCTETFARKVLASVNGTLSIESTPDGKNNSRIVLQFITRVFLTRQIDHRRSTSGSFGAVGHASLDPAALAATTNATTVSNTTPPNDATAESRARLALDARERDNRAGSQNSTPAAEISRNTAYGSEVTIHEVFQRPVAFGFRAITLLPLTNDQPVRSD